MVTKRWKRERARDRDATRGRLLQAASRLLARKGFGELGVNAVAREAGVDKVLVYRYFGGLPELLGALAERPEFWPVTAADPGAAGDPESWGRAMLIGLFRGLRARPLTAEALRWELVERNQLTDRMAEARERTGLEALAHAPLDPALAARLDVPAVAALLSAGLIYLVLRSKTADAFLGVDLRGDEGAARIEGAAALLLHAAIEQARGTPETTKRRRRR
jgi:AcrR family transcriptional regulator